MASDTALIELRVNPRARRAGLAGRQGGMLKVDTAAPAVEGRANRQAIALLARTMGVPPTAVRLMQPHQVRQSERDLAGRSQSDDREGFG